MENQAAWHGAAPNEEEKNQALKELKGCPTKLKRIGIEDQFGQSGDPNILLEHYNLTTDNIIKTVKSL